MNNVSEFNDSFVSHTYATSGNYNIEITAIACNDSSVVAIPTFATAVSIAENLEGTVRIFPKPVNETVVIEFENKSTRQTKISVINFAGQIVFDN